MDEFFKSSFAGVKVPKTADNFRIKYDDGSELDMAEDLFVLVRSFRVSSPSPTLYRQKIQGRNGAVTKGRDLDERTIQVVCELYALDEYDYELAEKDLYKTLFRDAEFYVIQDVMPTRQWRVSVDDSLTPTREGSRAEISFTLTVASGFSESIGALNDPLTFDEHWAFGDNLPLDADVLYTHTKRQFEIWNLGDVTIDPRNAPVFKLLYKGASNVLTVENRRTGDVWRLNERTNANDHVLIDGVVTQVNGQRATDRTNFGVITLAPGKNEIRITGTSGSFEIAFDFRFLYF